jgi:hypothetical protein
MVGDMGCFRGETGGELKRGNSVCCFESREHWKDGGLGEECEYGERVGDRGYGEFWPV